MQTPSGTLIEMFEVDASAMGAGIFRFHAGTNEFNGDLIWQGNTYAAFPVEASGFDISGNTQLPRPKLTFSNVNQVVGALVRSYQDLLGAKVSRFRTYAKYLDEANFVGGNAQADPNAHFPPDIFIVERKVSETKLQIEFELTSAVDLEEIRLPKRQLLASSCNAVYKSSRCGYAGALATCDKGLNTTNGCVAHFGVGAELPFNGFPGCGQRRQ